MVNFLLCAIWMVTVLLSGSAAAEEKEMVYAPRAKQNELFVLTQREGFLSRISLKGCRIVLESITPVYTIDVDAYKETGTLCVKPKVSSKKCQTAEGDTYLAKMVDADHEFAGNVVFFVEDGVAQYLYRTDAPLEFPRNRWYSASFSYADHAARIRDCLGRSDFVPATSVKYVTCSAGEQEGYFYIQEGDTEVWIPVGRIYREDIASSWSDGVKTDPVFNREQLQGVIQDYLDRLEEQQRKVDEWNREWEKKHPGEPLPMWVGGRIETPASICSRMDNILNIDEYLGIPVEGNPSPVDASAHRTPWLWLGLACGCVVLAAGGAVGVGIRKKRNRRGSSL